METISIAQSKLGLIKGDITDLEVEAFVFYAQHNLKLGSGFGNAISMRGGTTIAEELKQFGEVKTCDVVVTNAGEMKAGHIIHAVGPRFMEENLEEKLKTTIVNCLKAAEENNIRELVFPPMGTGFYGVPLDMCAGVLLRTVKEYMNNGGKIENINVCLMDNREYGAFEKVLAALNN